MTDLLGDLRYGFRTLVKSRTFAAIAILTLALGIGANTALFSVVNAVLLRPLPLPDSDRLVVFWQREPELPQMMVSYPDFLDYRAQNRVFDEIALYNRFESRNLTGTDRPERLSAAFVTSGLVDVLGVRPALGRGFRSDEDERGTAPVVILSHGLWQRRFGGDAAIVGNTLTLDGEPHEVVGVMPADLQFLTGIELWLPMGEFISDDLMSRGNHMGMIGVARLKAGVALAAAQAEMDTIAGRLAEQYKGTNTGVGVVMSHLFEARVGGTRPALLMILGAVGLVLLIACANVANLLLARAVTRRKEAAIRAALGANGGRLFRQRLTESLLLAFLGAGLGVMVALWSLDALRAWLAQSVPRSAEIDIDLRVLAFTVLAAVVTGVLVGLAPALRAARTDFVEALKDGGRGADASGRQRARGLLVVSQVAASVALLIGAGLLIRSFAILSDQPAGFAPQNLLTLRMSLPSTSYATDEARIEFFRRLLEEIAAVPSVDAAGLTGNLPFSEDGWQTAYRIEGQPDPEHGRAPLVETAQVSSGYFRAMGIPILAGRAFTDEDAAGSSPAVIVSESFAKRFWPDGLAIGRRVQMAHTEQPIWLTVVGVVQDTRRVTLERVLRPEIYFPHTQLPTSRATLVVRAGAAPAGIVAALLARIHDLDHDLPVYGILTMEERLASSLSPRRFSMVLLGAFAGLAFLLAAIGLYGVISYSVAQRTREIGIRVALGARRSEVVGMVLRQGVVLTALGTVVGVAAALALTRFLRAMLYGVEPTDAVTFVAVPTLVLLVALAACALPAHRATRVDPMVALRCE